MDNQRLIDLDVRALVVETTETLRRVREENTAIRDCFVRQILDRVGEKWVVLLLFALNDRPHRFGELHRAIPDVSKRMLTQTLRDLECDGLVDRRVLTIVPAAVEYRLSALGASLLGPLSIVIQWADAHQSVIEAARARFRDISEAAEEPFRSTAVAPLR